MERGFSRTVALCLGIGLSGGAALADSQAIPKGTELSAAQAGHAFGNACRTGQPGRMEKAALLWETAFDFTPVTGAEAEAEFHFVSPEGVSTVTATSGLLKAECTMQIAAGAYGDGSALYESVEAHVSEWWRDSEVATQAIDGGIHWRWQRSDVTHDVLFLEQDGAFTLRHTAER